MKHTAKGAAAKRSPLYTPAPVRVGKLEFIRDHGKDSDGACRTRNRIDGAGGQDAE